MLRIMSGDLRSTLAVAVRVARQHLRLTQEELAARIKRTPESISNIERGQQLPSVETLADLGRALNVPMSEFFGDDGRSPITPERARLEAELRQLGRTLSDRDLAIAVAQAAILFNAR